MHIILPISIFFLAVVVHEYAHGLTALFFGDNTAKDAGRLTLNPIAHIDPFGTLILPLMLIFSSKLAGTHPVIFGWAKPVPINYWGLRNPKRDIIWVGLSGPCANFLMALVLSSLIKLAAGIPLFFILLIKQAIFINLLLGVFNLMPFPPLDGSRVVIGLLPNNLAKAYAKLERYGFIILIAILYLIPGVFDAIIYMVNVLANFLKISI